MLYDGVPTARHLGTSIVCSVMVGDKGLRLSELQSTGSEVLLGLLSDFSCPEDAFLMHFLCIYNPLQPVLLTV